MKIDFVVHNASVVPMRAMVDHGGAKVAASLDCLEVELATTEDSHGSLTLRFSGSALDEAKEKFVPGETVSWTV